MTGWLARVLLMILAWVVLCVWLAFGQTDAEYIYKMCEASGFLLRSDSPALAKNWTPDSGLDEPPWFDINGNPIDYIGACPEQRSPEQPPLPIPAAPTNAEVRT